MVGILGGLAHSGGDAIAAPDDEFQRSVARLMRGLKENPNYVPEHALYACQDRLRWATRLERAGHGTRANRSLDFCFDLLGLSRESTEVTRARITPEERAAAAQAEAAKTAGVEFERALGLEPDLANGLRIYRECARCHTPEGWGLSSGVVPQLAGQHRKVIIKQLADIRAGNRENRLMIPYASVEEIGGPQAVADVAGYIDTLEISVENGKGPGEALALGARLYAQHCASCHGEKGEGVEKTATPRIQAQHYDYLVTQFERIREGRRRNASPQMVEQIRSFEEHEIHAILDYVSRLEPPEALQAPPGWRNPDFATPPSSPPRRSASR